MPGKKAVVLTFDRLPVKLLGCYGNLDVITPHFDRLASCAAVMDSHYGDSVGTPVSALPWWTGFQQHPLRRPDEARESVLEQRLAAAGIAVTALVESPVGGSAAAVPPIGDPIEIDGLDGLDVETEETPLAQLMAEADRQVESMFGRDGDELLWLASRGLPLPWVPPFEYAQVYLDDSDDHADDEEEVAVESEDEADDDMDDPAEHDPQVENPVESETSFTASEQFVLSGGQLGSGDTLTAEDWRLSNAVCAGYVSFIDRWIGYLLDALEPYLDNEDFLLIVTAARGETLGERIDLDQSGPSLGDELARTALFVLGGGIDVLRSNSLTHAIDIAPTLIDWFEPESDGGSGLEGRSLLPRVTGSHESEAEAERILFYGGDNARAVRTRNFCLVADSASVESLAASGQWADADSEQLAAVRTQLFAKPDDVWCVHDVSIEYPDVRTELLQTLVRFAAAAEVSVPVRLAD